MSFCLAFSIGAHNEERKEVEANMEGLQLTIESKNVQPGEDFCLSVSVQGFENLIGMQFSINYDPDALDFQSISNLNLSGLTEGTFGRPVGANGTPPGIITLAWVEPALSAVTLTDGTVIFDICFTAKDASTSDVVFSATPTAIEITNSSEQSVMFMGIDGAVVVGDGGDGGGNNGGGNNGGGNNGGGNNGGGNTTDFILNLVDQTVNPGEDICIPVTVQNFNNIIGMQFSINYDPNILEFKSVGGFNLSGLTAGAFGTPGPDGTTPGIITLAWVEPALNAVTLDNGTAIFELCFTPQVNSATSDVIFSNNPTSIEITDGDEMNVPFTGDNSTVVIGDGEGEGFRLAIGDGSVKSGNEICIPVTVRDFENIIGMQFTINYDPDELQFNSVGNFNLSGLTAGAFGTPGPSGTSPGVITMVWVEPALTPVTLDNGTAIFELCFTATGDNGTTTDVIFSSTPTNIEITNGDEENVPFMSKKGVVTIDDNVVSEDALILSIEDTTVATGTDFCVDVIAENFTDLVGIQFTIGYDASELQFNEVTNFGITGLNASQFATPSDGIITLAWVDPAITGVTVADSSVVFSLCFTALGTTDSTKIVFQDTPTAIEVTKKEGDSETGVDFLGREGTIEFSSVPPPNIVMPATITDATCSINNNPGGAIEIEVQGGSGNYSFAWSFDNRTTQNLMNVPAGTYTVTVTDTESSLTDSETFTVGGPNNPIVIDDLEVTDVTCFGASTGAINVSASGGVGDLTISWNQGLADGPSQIGLSAGNGYSFTITDGAGCSLESDLIILDQPTDLVANPVTTPVQCEGDTGGSITLNITGGSPVYDVDWPDDLTDDLLAQTDLTNGIYRVAITDANNCPLTLDIEVGVNSPLNLSNVQIVDIDPGVTFGRIDIEVTGGSNNMTYNWTGPDGFTADSEDLNGLVNTGEYCLTLTDNDGGCSIQRCINVYNILEITGADILNTCADTSSGGISLQIAGGEAPYFFEWDNEAATQDITGLAVGTYTVTVVDNRGISISQSFEVGAFSALALNSNVIPVTGNPDNTNGSVNLIISGGLPGYDVNWDNGSTSQVLSEVGVGEYCVTITDQNGCEIQECVDVFYQPIPLSVTPSFENISCNGEEDGSITLVIAGGLSPYMISFSDGMSTTNTNGLVLRGGLTQGTVGYTIEDTNGETIEGSVTIEEPDPIQITGSTITHDTESPGCTGSIELMVAGGTPEYTIQWNSPNMGSNIINLCAGEFTPTVIDDRGCTATLENPIVVTMFSVNAIVSNADCQDSANGAINLEVNGGEGPYSYVWKNSVGQTISQDEDPDNLAPGMYTVSVSETSGNTLVKQIEIFASSSLDVEVDIQSDFNGFAVSCPDANDGIVNANAINGSGNYSYEWVLNNQMVSMDANLRNAVPGNYELTAVDGNGCTITKQVTLSSPPQVNLNASTRDVSCNGARDGEVVIIASGGGGSNLTYNWSNGGSDARISFLSKGDYSVTVTDENNCSVSGNYSINEPEAININIETVPANDGCNGSATANVSGGTGPYTFQWNAGLGTEATQRDLCPGDYMVIVTDANGCSNLNEPALLSVQDRRFPCVEARVVITPDGDGLNEEFIINCIDELRNNNVKIYNRWGQLVYEVDNYDNTWNGRTTNGDELPDGPYYYIIEYENLNKVKQQIKGSISVLRE